MIFLLCGCDLLTPRYEKNKSFPNLSPFTPLLPLPSDPTPNVPSLPYVPHPSPSRWSLSLTHPFPSISLSHASFTQPPSLASVSPSLFPFTAVPSPLPPSLQHLFQTLLLPLSTTPTFTPLFLPVSSPQLCSPYSHQVLPFPFTPLPALPPPVSLSPSPLYPPSRTPAHTPQA